MEEEGQEEGQEGDQEGEGWTCSATDAGGATCPPSRCCPTAGGPEATPPARK